MNRALGAVVACAVAAGLLLSSSGATVTSPATQVASLSHHVIYREQTSQSRAVSANVVLTRVTIPRMPPGPNWRCSGNILFSSPQVCIYVRYIGTKVLTVQGEIWMRIEGPVTGMWTVQWTPQRSMVGHFWYQSRQGRYGASLIANHWFTPTLTFNRTVPRNTYVSFAFWEWYNGRWNLKRVQYFAIV